MPKIRPSSDLRNKYNEISSFCHEHCEPVYITKNGKGDLAVLSIETYEKLVGKYELEKLLSKGMKDIKAGRVSKIDDALAEIERDKLLDKFRLLTEMQKIEVLDFIDFLINKKSKDI